MRWRAGALAVAAGVVLSVSSITTSTVASAVDESGAPDSVFEKEFSGIYQMSAFTNDLTEVVTSYLVWGEVEDVTARPRGDGDYVYRSETHLSAHGEVSFTSKSSGTSTCTVTSNPTRGYVEAGAGAPPFRGGKFDHPVTWSIPQAFGGTGSYGMLVNCPVYGQADTIIPTEIGPSFVEELRPPPKDEQQFLLGWSGEFARPFGLPIDGHFYATIPAPNNPNSFLGVPTSIEVNLDDDVWFGELGNLHQQFVSNNKVGQLLVADAIALLTGASGDPPPLAGTAGEVEYLPGEPVPGSYRLQVQARVIPTPKETRRLDTVSRSATGSTTILASASVRRTNAQPFALHLHPTQAGASLLSSAHGALQVKATISFKPKGEKAISASQSMSIPAS